MASIAQGGIPVFNKELNKYVDKEEMNKIKEEAEKKRIEEELTEETKDYSAINGNGIIIDGTTMIAETKADETQEEEEDDLPF